MIASEKTSDKTIETTWLRLGNGWKATAVLSGLCGKTFSKTDWAACLSQPHLLLENVEKILKTEGQNCVAVKNLTIGNNRLKVVIKRHYPKASLRQLFRSLQPGKALRNFKTAIELFRCDIPVAAPLAAMHQRKKLLTKQSIYITEYLENSSNLHTFASKMATQQPSKNQVGQFALKKQLCHQLATILASLHRNSLWHKDSKATNFLVCKDTEEKYKVLLVDMDGIRRYLLQRKSRQFRSLWRLAASLMSITAVNQTDYLRTFTAYCNLTDLKLSQRQQIFRKLTSHAKNKQRRNMLKAAANK